MQVPVPSAGERAALRGALLDRAYRVGALLGVGGTGVVFDAVRVRDGANVVVKTMRPCFAASPELARRLLREADVARAVAHPGLAAVFGHGTLDDGSPYVAMERVRGESLARVLLRVGILPEPEVALLGMRVASILDAVHARGYVHRDVKPEHVLLCRGSSGRLVVRLIDFGVCAASTASAQEKEGERGRVFGTPSYASPEQAGGDPYVDGRADVYALGGTLFEAFSGHAPFSAPTVQDLLRRILREEPPSVRERAPRVSAGADAVIAKAMRRSREARLPSARALAFALAPLVRHRLAVEQRLAGRLRTAQAAPQSMRAPLSEHTLRAGAAA